MRQATYFLLLVAGSLICFGGYCAALIDWLQDLRTGVYEQHHGEAFLETTALSLYTYLGIRFLKLKIPLP